MIENPDEATVEQLFAGARACPTQAIIIEQFGRRVYPTILTPMFGAAQGRCGQRRRLDRRRRVGPADARTGHSCFGGVSEEASPGGANGLRLGDAVRCHGSRSRQSSLTFLVILSVVSTVSAQPGTPVASPLPSQPDHNACPRVARVRSRRKTVRACHRRRGMPGTCCRRVRRRHVAPSAASDAFPVVACEATIPFGTDSASIQGQDSATSSGCDPPHRRHRRHRVPCQRLGEEISGLQ